MNKYIETDLGNVAPNPRGEYDPAAAYEYLDLVEYGGGSYLCIQESGTVTGVAPTQNKNTDTWQVLTIPGDLTPEYIAMHDDVVNKAESAQADAESTAADREQVESMLANVEQLHAQTETAAQEASDSRDSAAGYATAAEASRTAAAESEKNAQLLVTGFNEIVNAAKQEATEEITTARKTAVQAVAAQQVKSVNAVNVAGSAAIEKTSADAKDAKDAKEAAVSAANAAEDSAREATAAAEQAKDDKQSAETAATAAKSSAAAAETAQKAVEGAAGQIETNTAGIEALKEDVSDLNDKKITKFYASNQGETHLADSDNGKIQDMILYGKSEQNQYKGINLLPTGISFNEIIEVSIPKGTHIFWATDGTPAIGGNFRFYNEDNTQNTWFGVDAGKTAMKSIVDIDVKYIEFLIDESKSVKICLGIGDDPVYEPYTGGQPSPSPDYPQEIKSVVNPTVKVCGKNLLNPTSGTTTKNGITCTANGDGTYTLNGTATSNTQLVVGYHNILDGQFKMLGCPSGGSTKTYCVIMQFSSGIAGGEKGRIYDIGNGGVGPTSNSIETGANYISGIISVMSGTTCNNLLFKPMLTTDLTATYDDFEPYHEQTATLPYTLNAVPVESGGNVTIDGQQYIADYANVERGKLVKMVDSSKLDNTQSIVNKTEWLLAEPQEIDLTQEEVQALKALATYYPTTNIFINSEQLGGYTVFNYPISMANGWNYVKQQLNDNRDYIYDMDTQSAEAYVNSEYAVALTELEV